ncbi:UbiA family prenyltransferase [Streptomyces sp. NPDC002463]|uniref:UbiA family prenyltransferase n=1 Tax=Streptomyces sp. NPDC002463 TaxID=3364645 RepID=UPI0036C2C99C
MDATNRATVGAVRPKGGLLAGLARACHPGPTAAVTLLMTALAVSAGHSVRGSVLVGVAVLAGQLSVGWCNDAVDARRDWAADRHGKPVVSGAVTAGAVRAAAVMALVACVPLSLSGGLFAGSVHLVGVGGAWAYNLGLKATRLSWLPYAVGFAALPAFVVLSLPGRVAPAWWVVTAGALLGVGAHLGNVLPDIEFDLRAGVRGWPQRLGPTWTRLLLPAPLVVASGVLVLGGPGVPGVSSWAALVVVALTALVSALLGGRCVRLPFIASILVAGVDVALLVGRGGLVA